MLDVEEVVGDVEIEEVDEVLEVVDEVEDVDVVLVLDMVLDTGRDIEEVFIELVVVMLAAGETPTVRYAPTAAIATTTTTTPARAVVLTALRCPNEVE